MPITLWSCEKTYFHKNPSSSWSWACSCACSRVGLPGAATCSNADSFSRNIVIREDSSVDCMQKSQAGASAWLDVRCGRGPLLLSARRPHRPPGARPDHRDPRLRQSRIRPAQGPGHGGVVQPGPPAGDRDAPAGHCRRSPGCRRLSRSRGRLVDERHLRPWNVDRGQLSGEGLARQHQASPAAARDRRGVSRRHRPGGRAGARAAGG